MKKAVCVMFIFFTFIIHINAENWTTEIKDLENKKVIESELRYKFYKLDLLENIYEIYNVESKDIYDYEDYIYSDYSSWSYELPEMKLFREIEIREEIKDMTLSEVKYIKIDNFIGDGDFYIKGIAVIYKSLDKFIDYKISIETENELKRNNIYKLDNGKVSNEGIILKYGEKIFLELSSEYKTEDIKITLFYSSKSLLNRSFNLSFSDNNKSLISYNTVNIQIHNNNFAMTTYDNFDLFNKVNKSVILKYRYRDKLFKKNEYKKVYLEGYFNDKKDLIKDLESSLIFYKYEDVIKEKEICYLNYINVLNEDNVPTLDTGKIAYNIASKPKIVYDYSLVIGSLLVLLGTILLFLFYLLKKLVNKCRTK